VGKVVTIEYPEGEPQPLVLWEDLDPIDPNIKKWWGSDHSSIQFKFQPVVLWESFVEVDEEPLEDPETGEEI
jgi:hypothetical protein